MSYEDAVISELVQRNWPSGKPGVLLDAACGSGDRLRMLFEDGLNPQNFHEVIGSDFSEGMLKQAAGQKLNGEKVYGRLEESDLLAEPQARGRADLILCLWHVPNANGKHAAELVKNLAGQLKPDGLLIYDVLTTKVLEGRKQEEQELLSRRPELTEDGDRQSVWYEREDGTIGSERLFSPGEVNELLESSMLETAEVWSFREKGPCRLGVSNGKLDEQELEDYAKLIILQRKRN